MDNIEPYLIHIELLNYVISIELNGLHYTVSLGLRFEGIDSDIFFLWIAGMLDKGNV